MTEQQYKWTHIGDLYSFYSGRVLFLPDVPMNPDGESTPQRTAPTDAFCEMAEHLSGRPHQPYEFLIIQKDAHDYLESSFPFLKEITPITFAPDIAFDDLISELDVWLDDLGKQYGHWHQVLPLENYTPRSMYENAQELGLLDKAIVVHQDPDTGSPPIKGHDLNMN